MVSAPFVSDGLSFEADAGDYFHVEVLNIPKRCSQCASESRYAASTRALPQLYYCRLHLLILFITWREDKTSS